MLKRPPDAWPSFRPRKNPSRHRRQRDAGTQPTSGNYEWPRRVVQRTSPSRHHPTPSFFGDGCVLHQHHQWMRIQLDYHFNARRLMQNEERADAIFAALSARNPDAVFEGKELGLIVTRAS